MVTDVRITIYDPKMAGVLALDASGDLAGSGVVLQYEDTPIGCGAAKITLGLRNEDVIARGIWGALNVVEISTGDDTLQAPILAGATKLYVTSTDPWDTTKGEDAGLCYINGARLTMRIPVTGIGSDGGGPFLTVGAPLGGGSIPAEGAGAIIGRRRYCGRIVRRTRRNSKTPQTPISLIGMGSWLKGNGSFTVTNIDVGTAVYNSLSQFSARWPFFTVSAGNFPTVGSSYTGSANRYDVSRFVADVLQAVVNGDVWVLRVGHDRTPRLVKLYTSATNTYTYTLTLPQGVTAFEPLNVLVEDDATNVYNSVEVIGDVDPTTKMNVGAIVQDATSIGLYGQIDHDPITNTKCKTVAQCVAAATALLNASSIASQNCGFQVFIRNDSAVVGAPLGVANGDAVRGVHSVTVSNNNAVGVVANNAPDSECMIAALWSQGNSGMTLFARAGLNGLWYADTGSTGFVDGPQRAVAGGMKLRLSTYIDASNCTAGTPQMYAVTDLGVVSGSGATQTPGAQGRVVGPAFTVPNGATWIRVRFDANGMTSAGHVYWGQPMLSQGDVDKAYVANNATLPVYGLVASANTSITADGDRWQDVKYAAIEPNLNATIAERANAAATAIHSNTATGAFVDQYVISASAIPPTISSSSFTVNVPAFLALFASGTTPISVAASSFTVIASQTNWAWLNPNGTWTVRQDTTKVAGAIPYAFFQCSAAGVMGWTQIASVGVITLSTIQNPGQPTGTTLAITGYSVTSYSGAGGSAPNANVAFTATVTPPGGDPRAFSQWGAGGIYWAKVNDTGAADADVNPANYTAVGRFDGTVIPSADQVGPLPAGHAYQLALQLVDQRGNPGVMAVMGLTVSQQMNPKTNLGAGKFNAVADSGFAHGTSYWRNAGSPTLSITPISAGQVVAGSPGANTNVTGAFYSQPFTPAANQQVCISAGMGWTDVGGGGTMFIGIVDASDYNATRATPTTIYAQQAVPVAAGTYISNQTAPFTYTFSGTPPASVCFCWWWVSANYGFSMYNPQIEPGAIFTGYVAGALTTNTTGTGANRIDPSSSVHVGGALTDNTNQQLLYTKNHPAIQGLSNPNLIPDALFAGGSDPTTAGAGWTKPARFNTAGVTAFSTGTTYTVGGASFNGQIISGSAAGEVGIDLLLGVEPNTTYTFLALVYCYGTAGAGVDAALNVYNPAYAAFASAGTPLGSPGAFYAAATNDASPTATVTGSWRLLSMTFATGANTSVHATIVGDNPGAGGPAIAVLAPMLYKGNKFQDFFAAEPPNNSVITAHIRNKIGGTKIGGVGALTDTSLNADLTDLGGGAGVKFARSNALRPVGYGAPVLSGAFAIQTTDNGNGTSTAALDSADTGPNATWPDGTVLPLTLPTISDVLTNGTAYFYTFKFNTTTGVITRVAGPVTTASSNATTQPCYADGFQPLAINLRILPTTATVKAISSGGFGGRQSF